MILSHKYKFIFICNGKTGTTSMEKALLQYQEGEEFEVDVPGLFQGRHIPPSVLKELVGSEIWNSYFKFCFVRNTWDWFLSQIFHNYKGYLCVNHKPTKKSFLKNPISYFEKSKLYRKEALKLWSTNKISAEQIMLTYELLKPFRGIYSAKNLYQKSYVFDENGNRLVDFVGNFSNLEEDFRFILKELSLDSQIDLPTLNKNPHKDYKDYYTDETIELVANLFKPDIDAFGFEFFSNRCFGNELKI